MKKILSNPEWNLIAVSMGREKRLKSHIFLGHSIPCTSFTLLSHFSRVQNQKNFNKDFFFIEVFREFGKAAFVHKAQNEAKLSNILSSGHNVHRWGLKLRSPQQLWPDNCHLHEDLYWRGANPNWKLDWGTGVGKCQDKAGRLVCTLVIFFFSHIIVSMPMSNLSFPPDGPDTLKINGLHLFRTWDPTHEFKFLTHPISLTLPANWWPLTRRAWTFPLASIQISWKRTHACLLRWWPTRTGNLSCRPHQKMWRGPGMTGEAVRPPRVIS